MAVIYADAHLAGTDQQQPDSTQSGWQTGLIFVPLEDGGFIAIWADQNHGVAGQIWGRRYDSGGRPVDDEFAISEPGPAGRTTPSAAPLASGGFIVTWTIENGSPAGFDIAAQMFGSDGQKVGDEFIVNTDSAGSQRQSTVAGLEGGGFVVLWNDSGAFPDESHHAQVFDSAGAPIGEEIVVDPQVITSLYADVAALAGGGFVIVSGGFGPDGDDLQAQIYDSQGDPVGAPIVVNSITDGNQVSPTVAALPSGGFVVAWSDDSQVSDSSHVFQIKVQMFDAGGGKVGAETAVTPLDPFNAHPQHTPSIAVGEDGSFAVSWMEYAWTAGNTEIRAQLFNPSGDRIGGLIPVNPVAAGDQYLPETAMLAGGGMVVGWRLGQPAGMDDVQLRVFLPAQIGTTEDDFFGGTDGRDFIDGLGGNDEISGGLEDDGLFGGAGNDGLQGGDGKDELHGGDGDDQLDGDLGDDLIDGGAGADWMRGGPGNDALDGDLGNDLLDGGAGADAMRGGLGNDVIYFGAAPGAGDVADGGEGRDAVVLQGNITAILSDTSLVGIESISIQSGANSVFGDTAGNFYDTNLTTADGNAAAGQQLIVNAQSLRVGEDFIFNGSAESDGKFVVYAGHGVDDLTGGDGADVFFFEGQRWGADDRVDGGDGRDSVAISAGSGLAHIEFGADSLTNIESISLNNFFASDPTQKPSYELVLDNGNLAPGGTLIVNGSSIPLGQVVNIDGSAVHDGNLMLFAGGGHDVLTGGDGADLILGGGGADSLTGGAGADTFRYDSASDSAGFADLIGDFQTGLDKIDLGRIDADSHAAGNQAFSWIGSAAFSGNGAGSAGELRLFEEGGYQRIAGDTDGDGLADLLIVLQIGTPMLGQGDFLL